VRLGEEAGLGVASALWVPAADDEPAVRVTWHEARAFCRWAGGRLPRDDEWGHAAHAEQCAQPNGAKEPPRRSEPTQALLPLPAPPVRRKVDRVESKRSIRPLQG